VARGGSAVFPSYFFSHMLLRFGYEGRKVSHSHVVCLYLCFDLYFFCIPVKADHQSVNWYSTFIECQLGEIVFVRFCTFCARSVKLRYKGKIVCVAIRV
jgi:hypothetical protein